MIDLLCSACGAAGVYTGTLPLRDGELAHSPHEPATGAGGADAGTTALYCADCLAEIPRPAGYEDFVRLTVRDLALILAMAEGIQVAEADRDRIAYLVRVELSPEEYEREFPCADPAASAPPTT